MSEPGAIRETADTYWARHFGAELHEFQQAGVRVREHAAELEGYHGIFVLFHPGAVTVSVPPSLPAVARDALQDLSSEAGADEVIAIVGPLATRVIGPAYIGYSNELEASPSNARLLTESDKISVEWLRESCDAEEWEHGGSDPAHEVCAGAYAEGALAALAGYQVWGGTIAHITVVTHPQHRGRGHGRHAVACVAVHALRSGLLAQYRTLCANHPSMHIAEKLGFKPYATSVAIRLRPELSF